MLRRFLGVLWVVCPRASALWTLNCCARVNVCLIPLVYTAMMGGGENVPMHRNTTRLRDHSGRCTKSLALAHSAGASQCLHSSQDRHMYSVRSLPHPRRSSSAPLLHLPSRLDWGGDRKIRQGNQREASQKAPKGNRGCPSLQGKLTVELARQMRFVLGHLQHCEPGQDRMGCTSSTLG